jgi:hypothetical protein
VALAATYSRRSEHRPLDLGVAGVVYPTFRISTGNTVYTVFEA